SIPAPSSVNGTLCGNIDDEGYSWRLPNTIAATSAATPAFTCTTGPPAKSSAPILASQPPPHTQCAIGPDTTIAQSVMNGTYALKFLRSTIAPEMSAAVMMQNVAWKHMSNMCGMVSGTIAPSGPVPTPFRKRC